MCIGNWDLIYHLENAEITAELCDELNNFSFTSLQDIVKEHKKFNDSRVDNVYNFSVRFLECLERLVCYHFHSCIVHIFIA